MQNYYQWLHGQWSDRCVEKQPLVNADGITNVEGIYVVCDLTGIPLLKFSVDTVAKAIRTIVKSQSFINRKNESGIHDVVIIGEVDRKTSAVIRTDKLAASSVQIAEKARHGVNIIEVKNV